MDAVGVFLLLSECRIDDSGRLIKGAQQ